jgi:hypothetical protein
MSSEKKDIKNKMIGQVKSDKKKIVATQWTASVADNLNQFRRTDKVRNRERKDCKTEEINQFR